MSRLDGATQGVDQGLDARVLHLHRSLVDDQARADGGDQLLRFQTVGAQGVAGVDHIDDPVRQAHQRLGQVHDDIANVKRWRSEFQTRFKGLLETYLRLLDTRDPDVERMEEMEAKLTFLKKAK